MPDTPLGPVPLQDCNGIIDPSVFPVPTLDHVEFGNQALALRKAGESVAQTGDDIVASWGGLSACYTAPESEALLSALDPVSDNGVDVEAAMDQAATALGTFAEEVRQIKSAWGDLRGTAQTFRDSVINDPDWDKSDHWGTTKSSNVEKSNELKFKAEGLIARYERAQRTCANAINTGLYGRTHFSSAAEAVDPRLNNPFVYDSVNAFVDAPSAWGPYATSDLYWHQDALRAVGDFGMGIVEGAGGMVGAHSAQGWFEQSWGDSLKEYHWDNLTAAASLVGMYDAESDSLGWTGGETAREAWKDLAHAVVPWEEWDDSPGYVLATGALNIGALVGGVALTFTVVGAPAGASLLAWRGLDILDSMGSAGRRNGSDVDLPDVPDLSNSGGNGPPVVHIDTTGMSPTQLAELKQVLEDLALAQSGGSGPNQSNGSEHGPTGGDLNRAEEALSPESNSRGNDSGPGSKNSDGNGPSDWVGDAGPRPNNRGSESQPALVGGGRGNGDTLTESRGTPASPPPRANATDIDAPGSGNRSGNEATDQQSNSNGADLKDNKAPAQNQSEKGPVPPEGGSSSSNSVSDQRDGNAGSPNHEDREGGPSRGGSLRDGEGQAAPASPNDGLPADGAGSSHYPLSDAFPEAERYPDQLPGVGDVRPGSKIRPTVEELSREGRIGSGWEHFQDKEREIAEILSHHGIEVKSVQESTVDGRKSPEAVIAGTDKTIEFKILESLSKNTIKSNMRKGREQSASLVLDMRNINASRDDVVKLTRDPLRQYGGDLDELIIIAEEFIIIWP